MCEQRPEPRVRLWVVSLALFAGGFASRVAARVFVDNVAWSYPLEVGIQWYAYLAGLTVWVGWLVMQATPGRRGLGCMFGLLLAAAAFVAVLSSIPK